MSIVSIVNYICLQQRLAQLDKELKAREGKKSKRDGPSSSLPASNKSRRKYRSPSVSTSAQMSYLCL